MYNNTTTSVTTEEMHVNKVGIRLAAAATFVAFALLGAGCKAEEDKAAAEKKASQDETKVAAATATKDETTSKQGSEATVAATEASEQPKAPDQSAEMKSETKVAAEDSAAPAPAASDDDDEDVDESLAAEVVTLDDGFKTQKGATEEDGKWTLPEGTPTFHVVATPEKIRVDWYTYNGYRRYHADCHVCHGPDGAGSTFAPALADSLKSISYSDFVGIVASGRVVKRADGGKNVMPAFGANPNVMCFIDDIYAYLKARATGAWPRLKPSGDQRDPKPQAARDHQKECYGE